jgi:SAM-dependent methyltransferase
MSLATFVLRYLPPAPARVLEIGCGPAGDLAYALAAAGYAIVASLSMHHLADLPRTAERIMELLVPSGRFILEEWDRDRLLDEATARWYFHQRHAAAATGPHTGDTPLPARYQEWRRAWIADHGDLHGYTAMRAQLMAPFRERFFTWRPYLYRYGLHESLEPLERALIEEGAIQATGFRWVGERTAPSSDG